MTLATPERETPYVHIHTQRRNGTAPARPRVLDAEWLRQLCLDAGADDVGLVERERPSLAEERPHIERAFPRTLLSSKQCFSSQRKDDEVLSR